MKLLFDQNLSHRLVVLLQDLYQESTHVRMQNLHQADDLAIWNYAKEFGFVIVTQDADYADWNKMRGAPPKIVWLRCGNATVEQIHGKLRAASERLDLMEHADAKLEILEIW